MTIKRPDMQWHTNRHRRNSGIFTTDINTISIYIAARGHWVYVQSYVYNGQTYAKNRFKWQICDTSD
jgi:hypothetical protein